MKMSFFGEDLEERKEIIIALLVILFFGGMTYKMGWFSSEPEGIGFSHTSSEETVIDNSIYYKADTDEKEVSTNQKPTNQIIDPILTDEIKLTDLDGDGVFDNQDHCPDIFGIPENNGCVEEENGSLDVIDKCLISPNSNCEENGASLETIALKAIDTDGDSIPDLDDLCPTVAGSSGKGCPIDTDADGIPDNEDHCPNVSGVLQAKGCLLSKSDTEDKCLTSSNANCEKIEESVEIVAPEPIDTDGDSIPDIDDLCPTIVGTEKGCPVDSDADGVPDTLDRCADVVGTEENNGCPVVEKEIINNKPVGNIKVNVTESERKIIDTAISSVAFITGSSELTEYSKGLLNKVAKVLLDNSDYSLLIRGHTDSRGDEALNFVLSQHRAKSTFDYLASKGVSKNRMSHNGFGDRRPIASNETKSGRLKNRRVELKLYQSK